MNPIFKKADAIDLVRKLFDVDVKEKDVKFLGADNEGFLCRSYYVKNDAIDGVTLNHFQNTGMVDLWFDSENLLGFDCDYDTITKEVSRYDSLYVKELRNKISCKEF